MPLRAPPQGIRTGSARRASTEYPRESETKPTSHPANGCIPPPRRSAERHKIWIAVCVCVLVAVLKKELALKSSLATILSVLSVNILEKVPPAELLTQKEEQSETTIGCNQLMLNI